MTVSGSYTWAVGGGKGGVGKSVIAAGLAMDLAQQGSRVVLIDADLAGANLHTLFGIRYPVVTVLDLLTDRVSGVTDILMPTGFDNLSLICSSSELIDLPNPGNVHKQILLRAISEVNADHIIIDIGAGATLNNLDFFNAADSSIVVTSSAPTAVQNTYSFLKMALHRRVLSIFAADSGLRSDVASALGDSSSIRNMVELVAHVGKLDESASWQMIKCLVDSRYRLIVNMASEMDSLRIENALAGLTYQFLRVKLPCLGTLGLSADIEQSLHKMQPLQINRDSVLARSLRKISLKMTEESLQHPTWKRFEQIHEEDAAIIERSVPAAEIPAPIIAAEDSQAYRSSDTASSVQLCLNEEILYEGISLHVQTEDLGIEKAKVMTIVFRGGHILFSKAADYSEFADKEHLERSVADRVRWQHKAILAGIMAGKLRDRLLKDEVS